MRRPFALPGLQPLLSLIDGQFRCRRIGTIPLPHLLIEVLLGPGSPDQEFHRATALARRGGRHQAQHD